MALRRPTSRNSADPRSRTVVKPASSVRRAYSAAYCACSVGQRSRPSMVSRYQLGPDSNVRCVCASISPGRRVTSPRSITSAPAGAAPPTWAIRSPFTTTSAGCTTVPLRASNRRAALIATGLVARSATIRNMKTSDPALVSHRTGGFRLRAVRYFGLVVSPGPAAEDDPLLIPLELPELPEPDVLDPTEPELELPVPRLPQLPLLLGELEADPLVAELSAGDPVVALPEDPVVAGLSVGDPVVALPEDPVVDPPTLPDVPLRGSSA